MKGSAPDITLRTRLRPGDFAALAQLTEQTALPLSEADLCRLVLVDPRSAVIIAEAGSTPVGYVHVGADAGEVYLVSGAVALEHRRRGIGTALLDAAREHARAHRARRLVISGRPCGYASPGVDGERDPGTLAFLHRFGGEEIGTALAMERELTDLPSPATPADASITACTPEELPELLDMVAENLAEDWATTLATHAAALTTHAAALTTPATTLAAPAAAPAGDGPTGTTLIARDQRSPEHLLLGFAAWGIVGADAERFGPIGVTPAARGRGIGGALLDAALHRMAASGARRAWFQWTSERGPARALYDSRGFTPLARTTSVAIPVDRAATERTPR